MTSTAGPAALGTGTPYRLVWQPLQIGPVTVRHRIMQTPHGVAWGTNLPYDRQVAYYTERAKGGAALVCVGVSVVHRSGASGDPSRPATVAEPAVIPLYERLAAGIHEHDARIFIELAEVGAHGRGRGENGDWGTVFGPSDVPSVVRNEVPVPVDRTMIRELWEDYATAARNLHAAGIDGMTLHAAHSYLFGQFMSPAYNRRTDEYGGSAYNNCRLMIELGTQIREAVGREMALGVRMSYNEFVPGNQGIIPDMSDEYLSILLATGLFDFFDISAGGYHSLDRSVPPMQLPDAHIAADAKRARQIVAGRASIFVAGRILTVALAEQLLEQGVTDMVGMTRAQIADPFLVSKTLAGREAEINHCVGSNECTFNSHMGQGIACTVNPAVGRERAWGDGTIVRAAQPRRVAVVGGGPAGMRAAQLAAQRGHSVVLLERDDALGGALRLEGRLPKRQGWLKLIGNLTRQLDHYGVEVRTGTDVTAGSVAGLDADVLVVATGSYWDPTGFTTALPGRQHMPGAELAKVITVDTAMARALADPRSLGGRVAILDETAGYLPLGLTEQLASAGVHVEIYSRHLYIGSDAFEAHELRLVMQRLAGLDVAYHSQTIVHEVTGDGLTVQSLWGGPVCSVPDIDTVVLCLLRRSRRDLFDQLADGGRACHLIGDALSPRRPADAVYDGEKVGRLV